MKRVLSLVLALVMVLGTVLPVFAEDAATMTAGEQLEAYGLIAGTDAGLAEDQPLKRAEMAVILAKLNGKADEAAAYAFPATFTDLAEDAWYIPWVAYAEAQGWMNGDGTTFRPEDNLSAQEVNILMVEALGYTVEWADANAKAEELMVAVDAADKTLVLRGEIFTTMNTTLDVMPMDSEMTLGSKLALAGYEAPVAPTPETLEVVSVEALNLKEIQVTFNKDAEAARTNFLVNGATPLATQFKASDDGMVVTLYVNATLVSGSTVKLVVTGFDDIDTTKYDVVLNDSALPTVESVTTVGNKLIKVTFSEPVNPATVSTASFKIDGVIKSLTVAGTEFNTVYNLTLNTALADGEYTLVVNAASVKDYAANAIGANSSEFAIAKYAATPAFTVLEATQEMVKVQFDREPKSVEKIYYKEGSSEKKSGTGVVDADDATIYTFTFASPLRVAAGDSTAYMHKVTDYSGNTTNDAAFTVTATVDTVRPVYESITQKTGSQLEVKFSKAIVVNAANFTIKDSEDLTVAFTAAAKATDDTVVVLNTTNPLNTDRNDFTITVKNVIDTTYLANKATDVTLTITADDTTRPSVSTVVTSANTISVVLSEAHDGTVTVENFNYTTDGVTYRTMPAGSYIEFVGTKALNITLPAAWTLVAANDTSISDITFLNAGGIMDLSGNEMISSNTSTGTAAVAPTIANAYANDKNTIIVTLTNTQLTDIWAGDFNVVTDATATALTVTGAELIIADADVNEYAKASGRLFEPAATTQIIKLTIDEDMTGAGDYTVLGTDENVKVLLNTVQVTKNALGQALVGSDVDVADNFITDAVDTDNLTYTTAGTLIKVDTTFTTSEALDLEYLVVADTTTAPINTVARTGQINVGAMVTTFVPGTDEISDAASAGDEIFVRFIDTAGNKSEWTSMGTYGSYVVDEAKVAADVAEATTTKANIDLAQTALELATTTIVGLADATDLAADIATAKASVVDEADFTFTAVKTAATVVKYVFAGTDVTAGMTTGYTQSSAQTTGTHAQFATLAHDATGNVTITDGAADDDSTSVITTTVENTFWGKTADYVSDVTDTNPGADAIVVQ